MDTSKSIGPYEVLEQLGAGGMGVVYRALDTDLQREVALKILSDEVTCEPQLLARLEREAQMLAAVSHPNIAAIHRVGEIAGDNSSVRFIDMELIEGSELGEVMVRNLLSVTRALELAGQIAGALAAAHQRGIVHRDLKPGNVMVTRDGQAKLLDFGLAKETGALDGSPQSESLTATGAVVGTIPYMSPEQARGQELDQRCDVWAFGCLLFELLVGERAFGGQTPADTLAAILEQEPDWSKLPPGIPLGVHTLLRRCLRKEPERRIRDLGDARLELEDSALDLSQSAPRAASTTPRRSRRLEVACGLAGIVLGAFAFSLFSGRLESTANGSADNPLAGARFTRITNFDGSQYDASISPDGRFLAFLSNHTGPFEVFVGQIDGGDFTKLGLGTSELGLEDARLPVRSVGFNGEGTEIWLGGGPWQQVRSLPLLGGTPRNYLGEYVVNVAWSPDGERVAYHERHPGDPLYVANRSGDGSRLLLGPPAGVHQHFPVWSVDGEWIYVVRGRPSTLEMDLWRVRANGEGLEQLTRRQLDVRYPSPIDEHTVLYSARDTDGSGPWLWAVDVETKSSRRASVGLEQYSSVAASADGSRLVATVQSPGAKLYRVPILDQPATELDVSPIEVLGTSRAHAPRLSGSSLFFLSSRGSGDGLWRQRDGWVEEIWKGSEIALLEPAAVSPDSTEVVLLLRRDSGWRLHILSADGAQLEMLPGDVDARGSASWSPDGEWIVTGGSLAGEPGIFKIPVGGGAAVRIADGEALNPVWSPRGDLIVYEGEQVNVACPLVGIRPTGERWDLPDIEVFRWGQRARFLPDGSGLVFMRGRGFSQDFWLLDLETRKVRRLTELEPSATMRSFDITPDGEGIVFDRLNQASDIVLIER